MSNHVSRQNNVYIRVLTPENMNDNLDLLFVKSKKEAMQDARKIIVRESKKGETVVCQICDYLNRFKPFVIK